MSPLELRGLFQLIREAIHTNKDLWYDRKFNGRS